MSYTDCKILLIRYFVLRMEGNSMEQIQTINCRIKQTLDFTEEYTCNAAYLYPSVLQAGMHLFSVIPYHGNERILNEINFEFSSCRASIVKHGVDVLVLPTTSVHSVPDGIIT